MHVVIRLSPSELSLSLYRPICSVSFSDVSCWHSATCPPCAMCWRWLTVVSDNANVNSVTVYSLCREVPQQYCHLLQLTTRRPLSGTHWNRGVFSPPFARLKRSPKPAMVPKLSAGVYFRNTGHSECSPAGPKSVCGDPRRYHGTQKLPLVDHHHHHHDRIRWHCTTWTKDKCFWR